MKSTLLIILCIILVDQAFSEQPAACYTPATCETPAPSPLASQHSAVSHDDANTRGHKRELAGKIAISLCNGQAQTAGNSAHTLHMSARDTAMYSHDVVEILYDLYPE